MANADRRVAGDAMGDFAGARHLMAGRHDLLHQADLQGTLGIELVTQHQVVHRVAPTGARQKAEMGATQGRDAALGLHLAKARGVGGDDNVGRQHHLDAHGKAQSLDGGDDRLQGPALEREGIDIAGRAVATLGVGAEEFRHVEPGRRVIAGKGQHGDPQFVIAVERREGVRELSHHVRREGVLLRHIVDDDREDPTVDFRPYCSRFGRIGH